MAHSSSSPDHRKPLRQALRNSLLLPALLFVFFIAAPRWYNAKLHSSIQSEIQNSSTLSSVEKDERMAKMNSLNFQDVSIHPTPEHQRLHDAFEQDGITTTFQLYEWGLALSGGLLVVLGATMAAVLWLNRAAGQSSARLARNYRISWKITMATAVLQLTVLIPLLAYGTFEASVLATDHYYPKLLLVIVIGGVVALWGSVAALLRAVPMEFAEPMSRELTPLEALRMWAEVRRAAERLQATPPDRIVLGTQFSFYVTELAVITDRGRTAGRTLYLSYPLLKQLSRDEVMAIVGHELGHFKGEDTRLTREFYPIRRKVDLTSQALARAGWVGWPSVGLVTFFAYSFEKTIRAVSRQREFAADQIGAALTSPTIFAQALVRFQVLCEAFPRLLKDPVLGTGRNPVEAPWHSFIATKILPDDPMWTEISEQKLPHPLDTHPSLHDRLAALDGGVTVSDARAIALQPAESAYASWFSGTEPALLELNETVEKAMSHLQARTQVAAADFQTTEGKALLEQHFPEVRWKRKSNGLVLPVIVCVALAALLIFVMVAVSNLEATLILSAALVFFIGLIALGLAARPREWILTAEGLSSPQWSRLLRFDEVASLKLMNANGRAFLILRFKRRQKALAHWSVPFPRKAITMNLGGLNESPTSVVESIHRYYTRQI